MIEEGFQDFESVAWWGLFAPAGSQTPIIDCFGAAFVASIHDEKVQKEMTEVQMITLSKGGAADAPEISRQPDAQERGDP